MQLGFSGGVEEMETRRKRKMGLDFEVKVTKPSFLTTRWGLWIWARWDIGSMDRRPEGLAHARPSMVLGRPWLGPIGPQLGLVDRWGCI